MARSPLEVVQSAYQAFERGDLDALMEHVAEAAEWTFVGPRGLPYTGAWRGKAQIARWFASIPAADEILAFEPREFLTGGDHVTVLGRERARAWPSGRTFEAEWVHVFMVHDGEITRFWGMYDTEASADARRDAAHDPPAFGGAGRGAAASP